MGKKDQEEKEGETSINKEAESKKKMSFLEYKKMKQKENA